MAQEANTVIDVEPAVRNGRELRSARRGAWSTLIEAHADLFRAEAESAARDWRGALVRGFLLVFSGGAALISLNVAAIYALTRLGLSWGGAFLVAAVFWGAVAGGIMWYAKSRARAPAFAASQRQLKETAQWVGRRFF